MIRISETFLIAKKELTINFGRTILTMLGIVIGISSIMIIMAIGGSARDLIIGEVEGFGSNMIAINAGRQPTGPSDIGQAVLSNSLKIKDFEALSKKENVPNAVMVVPAVAGSVSISYESSIFYVSFIASSEDSFDLYNMNIIEGNSFSKEDVSSNNKVMVLGKNVSKDLFGFQNPIGKNVKIKGKIFKVIGVASSESASFLGFDDMVLMPYSTAMRYILGTKHFQEIDILVEPQDKIMATAKDIETILRQRHNISDPDKDDFYVTTPDESVAAIGSIFDAITVFLALVAAIALIVGGIGMMNIMIISVTERTREIGLRKALGATNRNIKIQFLVESAVLTGIGGIIGIISGALITYIITIVASTLLDMNFPFVVSIPAILLGVGVSVVVGIVFGIYPAVKAAKKDPVESLQYE